MTPGGEPDKRGGVGGERTPLVQDVDDPGLADTTWRASTCIAKESGAWLRAEVRADEGGASESGMDQGDDAIGNPQYGGVIRRTCPRGGSGEKVVHVARANGAAGQRSPDRYGTPRDVVRTGAVVRRVTGFSVGIREVLVPPRPLFVQPVTSRMHQSSWCASHVAGVRVLRRGPRQAGCRHKHEDRGHPAGTYDPKINKGLRELADHRLPDRPAGRAGQRRTNREWWSADAIRRDFVLAAAGRSARLPTSASRRQWCGVVRWAGTRSSRALDGENRFVFSPVEQTRPDGVARARSSAFVCVVFVQGSPPTAKSGRQGRVLVPWRLMGQQVHGPHCGDRRADT